MADYIRPTPRNKLLGLLADSAQGVNDFASAPFGYPNPPGNLLMQLMGVPDIAKTADRLSYGEPLTTGRGMTTRPRDEAANSFMALAVGARPVGGLIDNAAPTVRRGLLELADNAMTPRALNSQAGAVRMPFADDAGRAERMANMGMVRGWYRGGPEISGAKRSGPWYTQDAEEAANYAKRFGDKADIREYAIPEKGFLNGSGGYPSRLAHDVAGILDNPTYGKDGAFLANELRSYGPNEPVSGGAIWQALESRFGNDGAAEVLQNLGFKGAKGITGGPEAYVFKTAPVRDANKAAFNPANAAQDNLYGKASLPMLGLLGGTALGADYLLRRDR